MQRSEQLLLSFAALLWIATTTYILMTIYIRKRIGNKRFSVLWLMRNQSKTLLVLVLGALIFAPTSEELVFRGLLLVAFDSLTTHAWTWIIITGILFGLAHIPSRGVSRGEVIKARENGEHESDDIRKEKKRIYALNPWKYRRIKIFKAVQSSCTGILFGYIAVYNQSIWSSVGAHFLWNLLVAPILIVIYVIVVLLYRKIKNTDPTEPSVTRPDYPTEPTAPAVAA